MSLTELAHQQSHGDPGLDFWGAADGFEPRVPELLLSVLLPPPDNALHANGNGGRWATPGYKGWLRRENPRLLALLGDWQPDTGRWWAVEIRLWLPVQRGGRTPDPQNFTKALLDLLTGTRERREGERNALNQTITGDALLHPGALWDDDRRVRTCRHHVVSVAAREPRAVLLVTPAEAPGREVVETAARRKRGAA